MGIKKKDSGNPSIPLLGPKQKVGGAVRKWSSDHVVGVMIHERLWSTLGGGFSFFFFAGKGAKR